MHISSMTIDNYRTFRHVVFQFDRQVNYMVGDNNIGKSNFLCLLKWISHGYGFREGDFLDADHPIEIRLVLAEEAGGETAELYLVQAVQEVVPRLFDQASGRQLPLEYLRCLFYIDFSLCE
ncbi:MAG: AAA family ATPase, partial [Dialister sp.]|nr:AAA family ATPase [Dialister sp.]